MVRPRALRVAADDHLNLLAHHSRMHDILEAHAYALDSRACDDFPPLFCFGDLVELGLDCTSVENGGVARKRVPAIVIDILQDNWLRLLVFRRWVGNDKHSVFHVRSWHVHGNPAQISGPGAEMRGVVFDAAVFRLAMIAAAVFDDHSDAETWHMQVRPDFGFEALLPAQWDRCFLDGVCVIE
jgi:hypothetical protein